MGCRTRQSAQVIFHLRQDYDWLMLLYGVQERLRTNCAREPPRRMPDFMASSPIRSLLSRHTLRPQSPRPRAFLHYCHVASFPRVSRTASTRLLGRTQGVGQVSSSDPRIRQIVHLSLGPRWARIVTTRWIYPAPPRGYGIVCFERRSTARLFPTPKNPSYRRRD